MTNARGGSGFAEELTLRAIGLQTLMAERTDEQSSTPDMLSLMKAELNEPGPGGIWTPKVAVDNAIQMAVGAQNLAAMLLRALSLELDRAPREILQKLAMSLVEGSDGAGDD